VSLHSIAFLSNTITKPFDRFLKEYNVTHYPLDTIIEQLYNDIEEELIIILLDPSFFQNDFSLLRNAIFHFRTKKSTKIIINTVSDNFNDIYIASNIQNELKLVKLNTNIVALSVEFTNIAILDFYTLVKENGYKHLINEKNRYLFQTPFTKLGLELITKKIEVLISLFEKPRVKAIAVDADNTLWGGVVGEEGINAIHIDNNYPGVVYRKFQEYLLALKESGILLILLSKNDNELVKETFETRDMPLSLDDFVESAVNWNSKSENLTLILQKLKLTRSNIIFLDDSDIEISEMSERMEINSFKMNPSNPLDNLTTLQNIETLKAIHLTAEDMKKTLLYKDEESRGVLQETLGKKEDFIASLNITITVKQNEVKNLERITQLINKTNQFNLTTHRYELSEVEEFMNSSYIYDFSVKDKFGDMGLIGVVIIKDKNIDTFLMSCRVLGRGIEERILAFITSKHSDIKANFIPTNKNRLVENFYENNGFKLIKEDTVKYYKFVKNVDINRDIKVDYDN